MTLQREGSRRKRLCKQRRGKVCDGFIFWSSYQATTRLRPARAHVGVPRIHAALLLSSSRRPALEKPNTCVKPSHEKRVSGKIPEAITGGRSNAKKNVPARASPPTGRRQPDGEPSCRQCSVSPQHRCCRSKRLLVQEEYIIEHITAMRACVHRAEDKPSKVIAVVPILGSR